MLRYKFKPRRELNYQLLGLLHPRGSGPDITDVLVEFRKPVRTERYPVSVDSHARQSADRVIAIYRTHSALLLRNDQIGMQSLKNLALNDV